MLDLYDYPKYYEIAFSFRDIKAEVDVFEECFRRFSHIPVKSVLELGCGNCPYMEELVKRGYEYYGLDLSESMLEYSRQKAAKLDAKINLVQRNMNDFRLDIKTDFVFILLGSLSVKSTSELINHFSSVARVLKRGGLYFLDWCIQFNTPWESEGGDSWELERNGIRVKTNVSWRAIDRVAQTFEETIALEVYDNGSKMKIVGKEIKRAIFPQEFLSIINGLEDFEFVGWWNNWDLEQPLEKATKIDRPIALLRRT